MDNEEQMKTSKLVGIILGMVLGFTGRGCIESMLPPTIEYAKMSRENDRSIVTLYDHNKEQILVEDKANKGKYIPFKEYLKNDKNDIYSKTK